MAPAIWGQHFNFRIYEREDGMVNQQIYSICQDVTGYIWIGTANGVFRHDGIRFTSFHTGQKHANSVVSSRWFAAGTERCGPPPRVEFRGSTERSFAP